MKNYTNTILNEELYKYNNGSVFKKQKKRENDQGRLNSWKNEWCQ